MPADAKLRAIFVRAELAKRGIVFADIAREEGVSIQAVVDTFHRPSPHLEEAIASKLGLRAREMFPERFDATGRRRYKTRPRARTAKPAAAMGAGHG